MHRIPHFFILAVVGMLIAGSSFALTESEIGEAFIKSVRYEQQYKYSNAIDVLMPVQKDKPRNYLVNLRLGWLNYLNANYKNSAAYYQQAATLNPGSIEAKVGWMLPLLAQQDYAQAESVARQALKIDPLSYYANLRLSYALRLQGKNDQALEISTKMTELYPCDSSFLVELMLARYGMQQFPDAKKLCTFILALDPDNAIANAVSKELN